MSENLVEISENNEIKKLIYKLIDKYGLKRDELYFYLLNKPNKLNILRTLVTNLAELKEADLKEAINSRINNIRRNANRQRNAQQVNEVNEMNENNEIEQLKERFEKKYKLTPDELYFYLSNKSNKLNILRTLSTNLASLKEAGLNKAFNSRINNIKRNAKRKSNLVNNIIRESNSVIRELGLTNKQIKYYAQKSKTNIRNSISFLIALKNSSKSLFNSKIRRIKKDFSNETTEENLPPQVCLDPSQRSAMEPVVNLPTEELCSELNPHYNIKSCILLGHGNTITNQYIVLPENIGVTFYTEKGTALNTSKTNINEIFKTFNSSVNRPNQTHYIEPKSMMYNMSINFLTFFEYNETKKRFGNFSRYQNISKFVFSGIITKSRREFKPFYHLSREMYQRCNIDIYGPFNIRDVLPSYSNFGYYYNDNCKILAFGNNIFGIVCDTQSLVIISNTLTKVHSQIKNEIEAFINNKKNNIPHTNSYPTSLDDETYAKIKNLSFIHHNTNIISLDELSQDDYKHSLGSILSKIKTYNSNKAPNKKIKLCHGIMCRNYDYDYNLVPNPPELAGESASAGEGASGRVQINNNKQAYRLMRQKSVNMNYKNTFRNIWERASESISEINDSNISPELLEKFNKYYQNILTYYEENNYIRQTDYLFIVFLINKSGINRLRTIKKYIFPSVRK